MSENTMSSTPEPRRSSTTTIVLGAVLVAAIAGIVILQLNAQKAATQPTPLEVDVVQEQETMIPTDSGASMDAAEEAEADESVKVFEIEAGSFYYEPSIIRVKLGDTVRIVLNSVDMMHNFAIDEYDIDSEVVPAGESTTIEFVADLTGEFEYYCNVMQHRQMGQVGTFIVEE